MTRLIGLYPRTWRDRYEDEFLALLADRPTEPRTRLDIVRGALDARLHPQVAGSPNPHPEAPPLGRWAVATGWVTLLGAVLWCVAIVLMATGPIVVDGLDTYRDGSAAMPFFFLALLCLGAGMVAVVVSIQPSRAAHAAAYVSALSGLLWAGAPWIVWAGLTAFGGLIVVGGAAWRRGTWPAWRLVSLVTCIGLAWVPGFMAMSGLLDAPEGSEALFFGLVGGAWLVVGTSLVRPTRRPAIDPLGPRQD